jgi:hypothetical protein
MTPRRWELAASLAALALLFVPATASAATSFDDFGAPAPLTGPAFSGSNVGATGEANEPDHAHASLRAGCTGPTNPDTGCLSSIWGRWTSGPAGEVTVDTCGSDFDTTLAIYTGSALNALTTLASNDDGGSPHTTCPQNPRASSVTYNVTASTTTIGAVAGSKAATGNLSGHLYYGPDTVIESSPSESATITTAAVSFGFSSTSAFTSTFECSLDSAAFAACSSLQSYPRLSNGRHTFAVRATANGNTDIDPARVNFNVGAPRVTGYALGSPTFRAASHGGSVGTAAGTRVSFALSEAATMTFTVQGGLPGRRAGRRCVPLTRSNRNRPACRRTVTVGAFTVTGQARANRFRFTGRLRGHRLPPGKYKLVETARDAAGNVSRPSARPFRIVLR